jgi:hypothetical protein
MPRAEHNANWNKKPDTIYLSCLATALKKCCGLRGQKIYNRFVEIVPDWRDYFDLPMSDNTVNQRADKCTRGGPYVSEWPENNPLKQPFWEQAKQDAISGKCTYQFRAKVSETPAFRSPIEEKDLHVGPIKKYFYINKCRGDHNVCIIGITNDPDARFKSQTKASFGKMERFVLFEMENAKKVEDLFKTRNKGYLIPRETEAYRFSPETAFNLLVIVIDDCEVMSRIIKEEQHIRLVHTKTVY